MTASTAPAAPAPARPILETLGQIRRGSMLDECAEKLQEVVAHVARYGKPAKLTISLTVKPASKGATRTVVVEDSVEAKLPKVDVEPTVFFPTVDGHLSRTDPSQMELGLRGVPAPGERVDTQTGEIYRAS
jgi:hypothetical protein